MKHRTAQWSCTIVLLLLFATALAPLQTIAAVRAAVTLSSFLAESLDGAPEVYISWETATELDTSGFYVVRSATYGPDSSYVRVSSFEPARGDNNNGWAYDVVDESTELGKLYYYKLEEIPSDQAKPSIFYGPVVVIAGMSDTPTPTGTSSPTLTPTNTSTPTATPTTEVNQSPSTNSPTPTATARTVTTPGLAVGATVTPQPTTVITGNSAPASSASVTPLPASQTNPAAPQPVTNTTPVTLAQNSSAQPAATHSASMPAAVSGNQPNVPAMANSPDNAPPVEPIVIPVETSAPPTSMTNFSDGVPVLLIGLALLLLGGGLYLILRQTSR